MTILTYSELVKLETFDERLDYLKLWDIPHVSPRQMSESFYKNKLWLNTRSSVIKRDLGCDLAISSIYIHGSIYVHHMNPLTPYDVENHTDKCYDPENLICTSHDTHMSIHYKKKEVYVPRSPGDTKLW